MEMGRKDESEEKEVNVREDALTQPVWYWFISQPWAPEWLPYWAHLRKNLYLHSSNWVPTLNREPPLSHEPDHSDVSTVTHDKATSKTYTWRMCSVQRKQESNEFSWVLHHVVVYHCFMCMSKHSHWRNFGLQITKLFFSFHCFNEC